MARSRERKVVGESHCSSNDLSVRRPEKWISRPALLHWPQSGREPSSTGGCYHLRQRTELREGIRLLRLLLKRIGQPGPLHCIAYAANTHATRILCGQVTASSLLLVLVNAQHMYLRNCTQVRLSLVIAELCFGENVSKRDLLPQKIGLMNSQPCRSNHKLRPDKAVEVDHMQGCATGTRDLQRLTSACTPHAAQPSARSGREGNRPILSSSIGGHLTGSTWLNPLGRSGH